MIITSKIKMDLMKPDTLTPIQMMQDDRYTRNLELELFADGETWPVPAGADLMIRFVKADGTSGEYDVLPDGTSAWSAAGNVLTVALAPQVLTAPGLAFLSVRMVLGKKHLSTFAVPLQVRRVVQTAVEVSEDYHCITSFLPAPAQAAAGQYFRVASVDKNGKTIAVETADLDGIPGADGITPHIGENGNWFLGDVDTGKPSRGEAGPQGIQGEQGIRGEQGVRGEQGPRGERGQQGIQGERGQQGIQGPKGDTGPQGADGKTPVRGTDYYTEVDKAEMVEAVKASLDGIPSYWQPHLEQKISLIREAMLSVGANKSAFFFYSDSHWSNDTAYTAKMAPALLKYLCKHTPINKVNFGGDIVSAEANTSEVMAYLWDWRSQVYGLNHHSVPGNHDDGNTTDRLFSEQFVYGYLLAPEETADIVWGAEGMYYYIDNLAEKTRYLYLDTAYQGVTDAEQAFVKGALLSAPENWHIVPIAHLWRDNTYSGNTVTLGDFDMDAKILLDMFDSYNARSGEFAESSAWVEFCIGGHFHQDAVKHTDGGIPVIIVEADTIHNRNGTAAAHGTITESAISAVIADYNTKTVKVIRVGRGADYDTTINVSTIKYTNVIPLSIDSTGAVFNGGKGWADKGRIGSGKLESYIGGGDYYITGHIEINPAIDNTIRLRNITFKRDTAIDKIGIAFYDASFSRVYPMSAVNSNWFQPLTITDMNGYAPVFDGTNIVQFTLKSGIHIDNTAVKYFAICAEYIGDDSIITVNEPLD